jgi:hypothetical protein
LSYEGFGKKKAAAPKSKLGPKARKAAAIIKEKVAAGEALTEEVIKEAHDIAYEFGGDRKLISTYAGRNMRQEAFLAELALGSSECRTTERTYGMMLPTGILKPQLGPEAVVTILIIRHRFAAGQPLSHDLIEQAHLEGYGIKDRHKLRTFVEQNLRRPAFRQAIMVDGFTL